MKKLLSVLLIAVLLFAAGCNKNQDKISGTPDTPSIPEDTLPDSVPELPTDPELVIFVDDPVPFYTTPAVESVEIIEDLAYLEDRRVEMEAVTDFLQTQFPAGCTVLDAFPVEGEGWRVTVVDLRSDTPIYSSHTCRVVSDGKYYTMEAQYPRDVTPAWQAVQAYRALYSALNTDVPTLLRQLGFDPEGGILFYNDFMEAMLQVMTREHYNAVWFRYFGANDAGLLTWTDVAGSGTFYAVDRVEPRSDGSWLSFEHYYDNSGLRHDFTVRVELNESENGYVVSDWDSRNEHVYDTNGDGDLQAREFPRPTGEAMGLTGEDAALYTAISHNLLEIAYPENAGFGNDLVLTSIDLLGSYEGKAGVTHYVCRMSDIHFYDAGDNAVLSYSSMGSLTRIARISLHENGTLAAFLTTEDGGDNTDRLTEIFGPLTEQRQALEKEQIIPGARRLLPTGETLLALYQAAYFPGT